MIDVKKLAPGTMLDVEYLDRNSAPESVEPHRHEYYEIFWVLDGDGTHSIDFIEYPLNQRLMYFITPGQVHFCEHLDCQMIAISFNPELIKPDFQSQQILEQIFVKNRPCHPWITIDQQGQAALEQLISVITSELKNSQRDNELINILFTGFLRFLTRYLPSEECASDIQDERLLHLLKVIDDNYKSKKHVGFYADQMNMSNKRINELSHQYFGKTVTQLIHEKSIIEARRELAFTRKTVKAIAYGLGFTDVAYFSRFYKKQTQESPQSFRSNWQMKQ